jgi:outer membrane protein assembly factor BamB
MGETKILNLSDGSETGKHQGNPPNGMSTPVFSPDGSAVYYGQFNRGFHADKPDLHFYHWQEPGLDMLDKTYPAVSPDGKSVFLTTKENQLTACKASNGQSLWKTDESELRFKSSPVAAKDGSLFAVDDNGYVICLQGDNGAKKWGVRAFNNNSPVSSAELVSNKEGSKLIAVMKDVRDYKLVESRIAGIDTTGKGRLNWEIQTPGFVGTPCLSDDGNTVFLGFAEGKLSALDTATGKAKWTVEKQGGKFYSPGLSADGKTLYCGVSTEDPMRGKISELAAFDAETGKRIDSFKPGGYLKQEKEYDGAVTFKAAEFPIKKPGINSTDEEKTGEKPTIVKKQGSVVIGGVSLPVRD